MRSSLRSWKERMTGEMRGSRMVGMGNNLAKLAEKIAEAARQGVQVERMWQQKLEDERKNQASKQAS